MRSSKRKLSEHEQEPVRVAVNIRPLIPAEIKCERTETINVVPGEPERNPDPMSSKRQKWESEVEQLQLQLKDKDRKIEDMEEKFKKMDRKIEDMEELLTRTCPREEIQDKDRKIEYLEEKFKKMEELLTRTRPGEEIQGPWSTRISNTEDFITPTPADSTPCSCTRFSSCRTTRCECHTMGRTCGQACKCLPWRCDMKSSNTTTRKSRCDVGASGISQGRGAFSE